MQSESQRAQSDPPHALQRGVARHHRAGGGLRVPGARRLAVAHAADGGAPARCGGDRVLPAEHRARRDGDRALDAHRALYDLVQQLSLERAELFRRRRHGGVRRVVRRARRLLGRAVDVCADVPHLSHLQGVHGSHRRRAAPRAADLRSAPRDDRSAGARDRREGSDDADAHSPRADVRGRSRESRRTHRVADSGRQDRGAVARHRQARGSRAHPVEAGTADAGRIPEDPDSPAGGRRDHRGGAVSLSGRAADSQPP